jgi:putative zinc finger protein
MRHIPEDELHAYLDQSLSRSQCVEIESHLAACPSCQAARDAIAALRDRTTALLARLAPPRGFPPEFQSLQDRAASQMSARRRRAHVATWAASLVAAVGLGWSASYLVRTAPVVTSQAPATSLVATPPAVPLILRPAQPDRPAVRTAKLRRAQRAARPDSAAAALVPVIAPPSLELSSVDIPRSEPEFELDGVWRTMSWAGAQAEAGDKLPHIDGLPVVQVQVQANEQGKQPLMVVAQQLASGEVIRTIEGPTNDVSHLLARRTMSDPSPTIAARDSAGTMAMQRGDRMLVITGALPPDSLLAMIRRLNAEMRSK